MIYNTTPSSTLFLHSSQNYQSMRFKDQNEVSGCKHNTTDNDWIIRRASSPPVLPLEDKRLRWKDMILLEHANTGKFFTSMAGRKNRQGFQEVCVGEDLEDEECEWVVEETIWVRQHILEQQQTDFHM
ncbi:hypothetical protein FBU30_009202 [Linnemannia zychae]|nr:hypothetical protein FBU30_009202 [Linnemannia zychae]